MSQSTVRELFDLWNAALATSNPETVADLYASDAVLLPTLSDRIRTNRLEIIDYFARFMENRPRGVVTEGHVHAVENTLVYSGYYVFTCRPESAPASYTVNARFTFVYRREVNTWKIAVHHSSLLPEHDN